ncbi:glycoside hydrolase family 130 protein [Leeuwenhoekiella sp. A16]|uniref:glycoside hydrolase family 130 protein n=1 Tax=unclassified Leeuwenhoekiella TaxID=2615029 RepID=UPI003A7FCD16
MRVTVTRKDCKFLPDSSRVLARFFDNGEVRTKELVGRIMNMSEEQVNKELDHTFRDFAGRHRNISKIFLRHCNNHSGLIQSMDIDYENLSKTRKMLIGSYSTMEYSIESAALFNPSIIEDFDQSFLKKGEKRIILSLRATGEGHLSSIVFRRAILDENNDMRVMKVRNHVTQANIGQKHTYNKARFFEKLTEMEIPHKYSSSIMDRLPDQFEYEELKRYVDEQLNSDISTTRRLGLEEIKWLVNSYYDVKFKIDSDISERVLFPSSPSESKGMEDARFVRFTDDDGTEKIYATYTAYNGHTIIPKLLTTEDFQTFRIMPIHGSGAQNKNFALFPRKIKGKYAMLARIDGVNNYLMYSDRNTLWNDPVLIQKPKFPWEFTQIGNCGPPLYTDEGWLVLTHGVGPMRRYCIGASLFDLEDPTKEIGRLDEPLLAPLEDEREGYVPNVVYSCGALIHNDSLILPYAVSDYSSSYAVVNMEELMTVLKS